MLYLGFPRYFIGGFPQGLIKDFQGITSWNFRRALSRMSEANRVFKKTVYPGFQISKVFRILKVLLYVYDFQGSDKGFPRYGFPQGLIRDY